MIQMRPLALAIAGLTLTLAGCDQQRSDASNEQGWEHPTTAWGDPDLEGMWPIYHMISTPFERPEEFGDRLHFTEEEVQEQREQVQARNERYEEETSNDRLGMGHWAEESELPPQTSLIVDPSDGQLPEMTEEGKRQAAEMSSSWSSEHFDSVDDFDTWDRCITRGMPPSMLPFQYNNGIEIVQTPGYVVINLEMIHEVRIVPVDGRPPLDSNIKKWMGSSRGHWEGNTLVVETTNFNGKTGMTNFGTPGSPREDIATSTEMKIVERFERVSEDQIDYSITVDDPVTMTQPWTAAFPWQRDPSYEFFEYACHEDNEAIRGFIENSRYERAHQDEEESGSGS